MTLPRISKSLLTRLAAAASLGVVSAAALAAPQPAGLVRVAQASADAPNRETAPGGDTGQSRNAARSRMRECGHQWSSMKKNGSAAGMTWKDFSQGCLAKQ